MLRSESLEDDLASIRGPDHYYGKKVKEYEARRRSRPQWRQEQQLVERFLAEIPEGSSCLDVPVGTGRYLPLYSQFRHRVTGCDLSSDMLGQAQRAATLNGVPTRFTRGSVFSLPYKDGQFDAIVCTRLLTWFTEAEVGAALAELSRVCSGRILVTANVWRRPKELYRSPRLIWSLMRVKARQKHQRSRKGTYAFYKHEREFFQRAFARYGLRVVSESALVEEKLFRYTAWSLSVQR
jgi:ubiquinone/menaquinone biosynthesis C-methylase UbiE